jgi:5'-nucleotidase
MKVSDITIYHTNDIHARCEIFRELEDIRKNGNTLLLDAGDAIAGSSTLFRFSEDTLINMNKVGYDALTMGNRELNYIRWVLKIRAQQADFPILSANLIDLTGKATDYFKPYIIKEVGGIKVGIFGLTPVQYNDDSAWLPFFRLRFLDPVDVSRKMSEELGQQVDLLILLSHLGIEDDKKIASKVDGIDLIIGGHSHTLIEYPFKTRDTYIFQAGHHGSHYGKINLKVIPGSKPSVEELKYELIRNRFS